VQHLGFQTYLILSIKRQKNMGDNGAGCAKRALGGSTSICRAAGISGGKELVWARLDCTDILLRAPICQIPTSIAALPPPLDEMGDREVRLVARRRGKGRDRDRATIDNMSEITSTIAAAGGAAKCEA
jgi:hypothetical protein